MKITSLKVYEGNNIKRQKRSISIFLEDASDYEIKKYLKAYFRLSFSLGYKEKLVEMEKVNDLWNLWVTYTNEELSKYLLFNILYNLNDSDILAEKAGSLVKQGFLYDVVKKFRERKLPVIEIGEDLFQLGFGKNSVIIGKNYQNYESMIKVEISRNRKNLWQCLRYSHIPKVDGKVLYSVEEIKEISEYNYPINIRSVDKNKDVKITINNKEELNKVLDNMMKMYTRTFVYSGSVKYRVICFKGEVLTLLKKEEEYKIIEIAGKKLEVLEIAEILEKLNSFCKNVYKNMGINFMYIDLQEEEEIKVVDLGCVFDIGEEIKGVKDKIIEAYIDCLTKEDIGIIPIISVTGTNGKTTTARLINHILNKLGFNCALTSTGGIYVGNKKVKSGDTTGFLSAREVLTNKEVEAVVLETARGGIYRNGLGYEGACAAVITSISEDHIGMEGIKDINDLVDIKSIVLDELIPDGKIVIKAQEELYECAKNKNNVCLFSLERNKVMDNHIKNQGEAFYLEGEYIIQNKNGTENKIIKAKELPFTHKGYSKGNILNIMAAIAAVSSVWENIDDIVAALKDLQCDLYFNPGRQNILDFERFKLMLDYGHNSEAYNEVLSIAKSLNPSKITAIIAAAGDRMDKYIKELGSIAAEYCDYIIIREQDDLRGRKHGESAELIREGAFEAGFKKENLTIIYKEEEAVVYAMERASYGEVIVLFTQCLDVIIPAVNNFLIKQGRAPIGEGIDLSH